MDTRHEILLEQILEELREQTKALNELRKRVDDLERTWSSGLDDVRQTVIPTDR